MKKLNVRAQSGLPIRMVALAAVIAALATACDRPYGEHLSQEDKQTTEIEEIEDEPAPYIGKTVSVLGEINTTYGDRAFELEGLDWLFDDEVLVVGKNPMKIGQRAMDTDDIVRVEGKVWKFSQGKLESELGWKFDSAFEADWNERPVIVAKQIEVIRRQALWHDTDKESGILTSPWPSDWSESSLDKAGVDFERVRVNDVGKVALWIGPQTPGTLVVPENPEVLIALKKGDYIKLEGNVRRANDAKEISAKLQLTAEQKEVLRQKGAYIVASALTKAAPVDGEQG